MRIEQTQEERIERRNYEMRADSMSDAGPGGFSGVGNVMGVMDAYRSVIFPGAYSQEVLGRFVDDGFITANHDWHSDIGTVRNARAERRELRLEAEFYNTDEAQEVRQKMKDRTERRKSIGLSVGFSPDWRMVEDFDSGEKLMAYAKGLGADVSLFDPAIAKYEGYCWAIPKVARLYEVAVASVPATPGSQVDEARSSVKDFLRDESLRAGMPLEEHSRLLLLAVVGFEARLVEIAESREDKGRAVPFAGRVGQIEAVRDSLDALLAKCRRQDAKPDDLDREVDEFLLDIEIARLAG